MLRLLQKARAAVFAMALALPLAMGALAAPAARAQSLNAQGVAKLNAEAQSLWANDGLPMARAMALAEFQKLVGVEHVVNSKLKATITRINSITLDCPIAPGVIELNSQRLRAAMPLAGTWKIAADVDVFLNGKILGIGVHRTYGISLEINDLRALAGADFDLSDPAAPRIAHVLPANVSFDLKVRTTSWVMNALLWLTNSTVNGVADIASKVGGIYLAKKLNMGWTSAPAVWGGPSTLAPVAPADLYGSALKMEGETEQYRRPWGTVVEGWYDQEFRGTWEQSFTLRRFTPGTLDLQKIGTFGDSALMTGYYLASLAFHYRSATDAADKATALARTRSVLEATHTLLVMRGEPGNLNRSICPRQAWMGAAISGDRYFKSYNGVEYVMSDYVSRDAYTGIFVGLSVAYDMLDAPADKAEAKQQIEWAIDYLLRNNWTWRKKDGTWGERWTGAIEQQLAWVLLAYHVNPAKYQSVLDAHKGYADLVWTGIWTGVIDTFYSYYKFSLCNNSMYTMLRLEPDPVRYQREYQGVAMLRRSIGHHQNAQFNCCYIATDPSSRARLGAENANLLTRFLRGPRRYMIFDARNDPTIAHGTYTVPFDTNLLFPGQGVPGSIEIAKDPIPLEKRISTGYRWSRSPFTLKEDYLWNEEPTHEGEGVDYVMAYWMSRYYGAIAGPVRPPILTGATTSAPAPTATRGQ